MKTSPLFSLFGLTALLIGQLEAQPTTPTTTTTTTTTTSTTAPLASSAGQAVDVAKDAVDASLRDRVISVYGTGTASGIQKWWVIFYDGTLASHGRVVRVEGGQVTKTYEAKGGVVYSKELTFPRTRVSGEGAALADAQDYAAQHALSYDQVRALLRYNAPHQELRWRVQLLDGAVNKGFVFSTAENGKFAMYAPAGSEPSATGSGTGGGVVGDAKKVGREVKNTFLGVGGDLEEFFTGDRTVDQ